MHTQHLHLQNLQQRGKFDSHIAMHRLTRVPRFMDEGMDHDDKYRMVEDEFLTVAQKWTVHLHAAEYKKQKKMVKARNAETIDSISRPVTGKMPDHTRRRVEGVAKSKAQRTAIEALLGKKAAADETDSDEDGLPYVGTSLHCLMDSPGKKAASLSKIASAKVTTRAAAGFQKPAQAKTAFGQRMASVFPLSKSRSSPTPAMREFDLSTASEDEDDDLDAPIPAPKLHPVERICTSRATCLSTSHPTSTSVGRTPVSNQRSMLIQSPVTAVERDPPRPSFTDFEPPHAFSDLSGRAARRLEQARKAKADQEKEETKKKKLDIIPTFM